MPFVAAALVLGGCSYAWIRPDATPQQVSADEQRCRAESTSLVNDVMWDTWTWRGTWGPPGMWWGPGWYSGWWPDPSAQLAAEQRVYDRCMRAQGYDLVGIDRKTGEPG
jgi:hypothetical protein